MKCNDRKAESIHERAESLDSVIAAPEHHKIIFENERVRVLEFRVKPGDFVPVHTHRFPSVSYVLSLGDFLSYDADGNLKLDSRTGQSDIQQGGAFWLPAFPAPHSVKNIGEHEMCGIAVELKD